MKKKLFAQFICKPRDESFEPSYSIIGQCLSNKNENATVPFFTGFCELNKATFELAIMAWQGHSQAQVNGCCQLSRCQGTYEVVSFNRDIVLSAQWNKHVLISSRIRNTILLICIFMEIISY